MLPCQVRRLTHKAKHFLTNTHDTFKTNEDIVYNIENLRQSGININIVTNIRIFEYLDFRFMPGISLGQRNLIYTLYDGNNYREHIMKIESIFMEVPFLLKFKAKRHINYSPYLVTGINFRVDWASKRKIKEEDKPKIRLNRNDLYIEIGAGIDFYLPYFKLSTEIKLSMGQTNLVKYDNTTYTKSLDYLHSKMWIIAFHFE